MKYTQNKQSGSMHIIITVILALIIVGLLGYVVWNNYFNTASEIAKNDDIAVKQDADAPFCASGENEQATNGVFCSEKIGIRFESPDVFNGLFKEVPNYDVTEGPLDPEKQTAVGKSNLVYKAGIEGNDTLFMQIASEPLRTGYVNAADQLANTYFNKDTGLLTHVSVSGTNQFAIGDEVTSFMVGKNKVFKGIIGDAGVGRVTYLTVVNGAIVTVQLETHAFMGPAEDDPSTLNTDGIYTKLDAAIRSATFL